MKYEVKRDELKPRYYNKSQVVEFKSTHNRPNFDLMPFVKLLNKVSRIENN